MDAAAVAVLSGTMDNGRLVRELTELLGEGPRSLGEVLELLKERGFGALLSLLAFPAALPLPAAGYSIPFGIGILALGVGLMAGRERPWLPARILRVPLPRIPPNSRTIRFLSRVERLLRERPPRPEGVFKILAGAAASCMGLLMMIPIPGTNTLPALTTLLLGLGILYRDGLWSSVGIISGFCLLGLYSAAVLGLFSLPHLRG